MSADVSWDTIAQIGPTFRRPHVVILGAGASAAAFPKGDRNGLKLPVMHNLVETIGLAEDLDNAGVAHRNRNFEEVYASISNDSALAGLRATLEDKVGRYFAAMELPEGPTLYDYLVLSLRSKDVIATFNWDPFLFLAMERNRHLARPPLALFLHGCARIGHCIEHRKQGHLGGYCSTCGKTFTPTRLLYPVANKSYSSDPYIDIQWRRLLPELKAAYLVTVFGYSAPTSDAAAKDMMSNAWGAAGVRNLEEVEIIDIKPEDELVRTWRPFIHSHHYQVKDNYFKNTLLACSPRRSCEAFWTQTMDIKWLEPCHLPQFKTLQEMWNWFEKIRKFEG